MPASHIALENRWGCSVDPRVFEMAWLAYLDRANKIR